MSLILIDNDYAKYGDKLVKKIINKIEFNTNCDEKLKGKMKKELKSIKKMKNENEKLKTSIQKLRNIFLKE